MKKTIKLAAIHSNQIMLPEEANPHCGSFDPAAPAKCMESNMEKTLCFLHEAGRNNIDLVCTHEDFNGAGIFIPYLDHPELFSSLAEEIPGSTSYRLGEIAKHYNMYIAANYFEKDGNEIYNTSVLIGRNGEFIGKYRKVHLPPFERWRVTGGIEFPVFETDMGRIGFATCHDVIFPEHCRIVALNGADVIIHQTAGWGMSDESIGEALVRTRAAENSVYMVVTKVLQSTGNGKSCIIDNNGNILVEVGDKDERVITAEMVPDFDLTREDYFNSFFSGISSCKARQAFEREPSLYSAITEKKPPVLRQYERLKYNTSPDEIMEVFRQWKAYWEASGNNKPVKVKYHW